MNILHLSNVIGEDKGGGVHEVVSNLYKYQKLLNHTPHIWYPGDEKDGDSIRLDQNIKHLETYGNTQHGLVKDLFRSLPSDIHKFDIIHQHGIWKPISEYSKKIKNQTKIKSVIQPHGYLEPFRLNISKYKKRMVFNLFEKSNLNGTNVIVACSLDEAYNLKKLFPKKDVAVVPNGISSEFFNAKTSRPVVKEKKRMLFLSQIIPIKGLERLFKVINQIGKEKFNEWEFIIAGYDTKDHSVFLKKIAKQLDLLELISFVGPMLGQQKINLFDSADLFVLPTFNENYGIVVAEALSRGVPVLTTKGTPWEELSSHNCGYWVDNNENGIKTALLEILQTPQKELNAMGLRGRKLIESKYLWSSTTKSTIELYTWILSGGTRPDFII